MSYGGYNNSYNSYNNNGGSNGGYANPFSDRNAAGYNSPNVEMASFNQGGQKPILQRCSEINNGVSEVESKLNRIAMLQKRSLSESGNSATKQELDALTEETMAQYRKLTQQVREVKSDPASGQSMNASQVRFVEKRLRDAIQKYQELESGYRTETRNQVERQFRIVRPDATDAEVREAVENSSSDQVFQQALMRNARQAQANEVLGAVRQRHQEMLEIEKRLGELLDLMQDMQVLLAKQEVTIAQIDTQAEQAAEDMVKANEQLESAVVTARKTRKKKWICLGICVAIVVIIVVAVVAYIMVNRASQGGGNKKRSLLQRDVLADLQMNTARSIEFANDQPVARSIDHILPPTTRRRISRLGNVAAEKRFVVDLDGADPTGADK